VLLWKGSLPSQQPLLADVLDKVRNDAIDNEKRKRFIAFGQTLKAAVERRLKAGEPFDRAVAEEAGSARVEVKDFPPFTLRTQPHDIDAAVLGVLDNLGKGGVSDMQPTADKGYLVFAADKKVPILDVSNPRYAQIKAQLAMSFARNDSTAILGEAASDELKRMNASLK
jgi:peptidyl-prolyl cis-trans isomerase D